MDEFDILGMIDVQPTFMPGGELPVPDGDAVVPVINRLVGKFRHAFATQDWHPPGHISFASSHPGRQPFDVIDLPYGKQTLWPDHAIQNTVNAALHPDLDLTMVEVIVRKGFRPQIDSYSAFLENDHVTSTGLEAYLRQCRFRRIFLVGLATDFCVGWSAIDAVTARFDVVVIEDACRGVGIPTTHGRTTIDAVRDQLLAGGVQFINSTDL